MSETSVKFSNHFTDILNDYINKRLPGTGKEKPTVADFAKTLGVGEETLFAWAAKKKKDNEGNLTEDLARPKFNKALSDLVAIEKSLVVGEKEKPKTPEKKTKAKIIIEEDKPEPKKLNQKQELFCELYATQRDFFGNGTDAYAEAYDIDKTKPNWYKTAAQSAYRLLTNVDILKRIDELLELGPLNDQTVDRQLAFVVEQNADFGAKVAAIREYNKLKSRITEKVDATSKGEKIVVGLVSYKNE